MATPNFSALLPDRTIQQIEALKPLYNGNKTQIVIDAINRMYQQEIKTMSDNQGWFNRDTYYISEQMLGNEATEQDARTMVEYLRRADYNVEYGSNMNRHPAPFSDLEWQYGLDVINKGE